MGNGSAASFAGPPNAFETSTPQGVQDFARHYQSALQLLLSMASDYAAARCLLMNGHFPGLELGARAIEKALKAFLLLDNPARKVRSLNHSLPRLVNEVAALHPHLNLLRFMPQLQRFGSHFQARYPDNPDGSKSMSTAELEPLDEVVIFLNENLPIPRNVQSVSGLYGMVAAWQLFQRQPGAPLAVRVWLAWLTPQNKPLAPLLPRIAADYDAANQINGNATA
jgi:hypothetical protein